VNGNTDDNRLFIIYTTVQKFAVVKIFFFKYFFKITSSKLHLFDQNE